MIISGKELSAKLKEGMVTQIATSSEKYGCVPHLVLILVGEDPSYVGMSSMTYVVLLRRESVF